MHLHGFFYEVISRGTLLEDTVYEPENRRMIVTEFYATSFNDGYGVGPYAPW